jgi:hypothetical protein
MLTGSSVAAPGAVTAAPDCTASGCPMEVTLSVPTTHCPVTHGGMGGGANGQPATTHGAETVAVGMPITRTRGLGADGVACPPCAHITTAP